MKTALSVVAALCLCRAILIFYVEQRWLLLASRSKCTSRVLARHITTPQILTRRLHFPLCTTFSPTEQQQISPSTQRWVKPGVVTCCCCAETLPLCTCAAFSPANAYCIYSHLNRYLIITEGLLIVQESQHHLLLICAVHKNNPNNTKM